TDEQMRRWEASNALECMVLDGEKRYFRNAGPNLFRIDSACYNIKVAKEGIPEEKYHRSNKENLPEIINAAKKEGKPIVAGKRMRVTYTLTVDTNAVPAGEVIRCWLPYPRADHPRQTDVKFISASQPDYIIAPQTSKHSTLYMEKRAVQGEPTVFSETFEFTSHGEWHNLKPEDIQPYDTTSAIYKEYTAEREKHIVFSPRLRELAAKLTAGETNPLLKAKRIFRWVNDHFPWASAREYSTLDNIPEYVLDNGHGDCGQVSLLFMTLCRISGIPAHWQSGFMMHPNAWNLHDWAEVYFEGIGWVPVDQSFGIPPYAGNADEEWFFLGGIDSWRMIVNSDYGMPLVPEKKYPRSETVDFQRGEVEWAGGNLYFPQWDYDMDIEYLNY
ncbi:MAG: transglutaminase domain-containing protein, partial [Bacteroides sp.]|nr:transglutaminase domain-containing protein [Bacteroides sp.]